MSSILSDAAKKKAARCCSEFSGRAIEWDREGPLVQAPKEIPMTVEGTFQNGTIVLDSGVQVPDGTRVTVIVPEEFPQEPTLLGLLDLAGTVNDLPSDMALNHDHYLHGHPKK
jgi:hypothetical protein